MLNDFFDKIYCINLDRRPDRWGECKLEFDKLNLVVERVSAIDGSKLNNNSQLKNGALALTLTVYNIITEAIEKKYDKILILEDDIEFTENINCFSDEILSLPDDWDLLYFGGNHNLHVGSSEPIQINEHFRKLHNTYSTHAIGISSNGLKLIDEKLKESIKEIDVLYSEIQKINNVYCFNKLLATQRNSFSDIENRTVNYKQLIN